LAKVLFATGDGHLLENILKPRVKCGDNFTKNFTNVTQTITAVSYIVSSFTDHVCQTPPAWQTTACPTVPNLFTFVKYFIDCSPSI
jgi:hypothetical protein